MNPRPDNVSPEAWQFAGEWSQSVSDVLGKITGQPFVMAPTAATPEACPAPSSTDVHMSVVIAGALRGEMNLRLPRAHALRLAQMFMSEAPDDTKEFGGPYQEACEELFRQIAGQAATLLKPSLGEVQIHAQAGPPPSWPAAESICLQTSEPAGLTIEIQLSAALVAGLRSPKGTQPAPSVTDAAGPPNLAGLMDVEVVAKLRFGARQMLLRDVLELSAGSVIELDRRVQEPIDLLLNGKVAARGEVVVVDGNYGIRITEVVLPS